MDNDDRSRDWWDGEKPITHDTYAESQPCPYCHGQGTVSQNSYDALGVERCHLCRWCAGRGIIVVERKRRDRYDWQQFADDHGLDAENCQ